MRPSRETIGERTKKHGMTNTRLYAAWCGMKLRCYNSHYKHFDRYGGRGIKVCDEWKNSFEHFRDWALQTVIRIEDDRSPQQLVVERSHYGFRRKWIHHAGTAHDGRIW